MEGDRPFGTNAILTAYRWQADSRDLGQGIEVGGERLDKVAIRQLTADGDYCSIVSYHYELTV